jgi:hypothetical protein
MTAYKIFRITVTTGSCWFSEWEMVLLLVLQHMLTMMWAHAVLLVMEMS